MARYEAHSISHQFIREFHSTGLRTDSTRLHRNPFLQHTQYIVPPHDICFKNFSRTRIKNRRSHRIGFCRSSISQHRIIHVIHIYRHAICNLFCDNGIFKTGTFKSHLPVFNTLFDILTPTVRSRIFNIKHNRFSRFYQLATQVTFTIFRFRLQSPTSDKSFCIHSLLPVTITQ